MTSSFALRTLAAGAALAALSVGAHATVVLANNPAPGDAFTNASTSNQGQAVGASGWYYNNVRNSGTVGISDALPRSGNGSAALSGTAGPGGASHKADIEFLPGAVSLSGNYVSTGTLGNLSDLANMSYDWYRASGGTATAHLTPVMRVLVDADGVLTTTGDRGGLVYERVYNEPPGWVAPTNTWVTESITASSFLWNFGLGLPTGTDINGNGYGYDETLAQWQAKFPSAKIIGFSLGIGSGWGSFSGAVDNAGWTIGQQGSSYNFEVARQVPEPAPLALVGLSLAGLLAARRRRA